MNIDYRSLFSAFLHEQTGDRAGSLLPSFERYLEILYRKNAIVNMVSRRMPMQEYWLYHFLDSLLILRVMSSLKGKVLDFGSGGGLPGIPLKIVFPDVEMTLLDSVGKKVSCLNEIIADLGITGCSAVWDRLEDYAVKHRGQPYDYVVCRSVRMEDRFAAPMRMLLKPTGKVIFYKGVKSDDVDFYPHLIRHDVSLPELGCRQIIIVPAGSLPR